MTDQPQSRYIATTLTIITIIITITWLRHAQDIVVPFLVAVFIATIASSPVDWLASKKIPRSLAVLLVFLAFTVFLLMISLLLGLSLEQFAEQLPTYKAQLKEFFQSGINWFASYGINLSKSGLMKAVEPGQVMQFAQGLISSIGNLFGKAVIILFTALLMLIGGKNLLKEVARMSGSRGTSVFQTLSKAVQTTREYMAIKALMSFLMALCIGIGLAFIGLEYAVLWGVLVFLLNFIPSIGFVIAAVLAILFSLIQLSTTKTIIIIVLYFGVNAIFDFFVQPKFVGAKMGMSMLTIFLSLIFWGWVLGPIGMILSVPLTMMFKYAISGDKEEQSLLNKA